jgi:mono/diheme cytochrome c family protein
MHPAATVSAGSKAKMRGAELFATNGCAHCHGTAGVGGPKGPDLQLVRKRMKKAQIAQQIHDGGKSMPPYGDMLSSAQINDLVAYLRAKRKVIAPAPKPPAPAAAPAASDPD